MKAILGLGFVCLFSTCALAQSAWVPERGQWQVNPTYTFQTYDEFWMGDEKSDLPDEINQHVFSVGLEYGITDNVAFDFLTGFAWTDFSPPGEDFDDEGLIDSRVGLRYRFLDEFDYDSLFIPTLALRVGGIIEGTYDTGFPYAPGDGASGFETSLLLGKVFGDTGFGVNGEVGYRNRSEGVPEDFFVSAGVFQTIFDALTLSFEFVHTDALSGKDIGEPGFSPDEFPKVEEDSEVVQFGLGYTINEMHYVGLFYARTLDGRNTGEKDIVGVTYNITF